MRRIGFSTGALAYQDFRKALEIMSRHDFEVVELSALREEEVEPLLTALDDLDLSRYSYVSFHAPSVFSPEAESRLRDRLQERLPPEWPIIFHPDAAHDLPGWRVFGARLAVENMDKRKPTGRFVAELKDVFEQLPEASFCFDIGHARQVDPTMTEAWLLLDRFGGRLREVHISEVATSSRHNRLSEGAVSAFQEVANRIPETVPVIVEAPVGENEIPEEIERVHRALTPSPARRAAG